jgi:hypothetical protein
MTAVLAPPGVGVWGQPLRPNYFKTTTIFRGADAPKTRGGTAHVPMAVAGFQASAGSVSDPMGKRAAIAITADRGPYKTLRDALHNRDASRDIHTPVADAYMSKEQRAQRIVDEGTTESAAFRTPITVAQAVAILKAAEETFASLDDVKASPAEIKANDDSYNVLVADAKKLRLIQGATLRRPINSDEQEFITELAGRYSSVMAREATAGIDAARAALVEDSRPATEEANRARRIAASTASIASLDAHTAKAAEMRDDAKDNVDVLLLQRANIVRASRRERAITIRVGPSPDEKRAAADRLAILQTNLDSTDREIANNRSTESMLTSQLGSLNQARNASYDDIKDANALVVAPSDSVRMRNDTTARFAKHDRANNKLAAQIVAGIGLPAGPPPSGAAGVSTAEFAKISADFAKSVKDIMDVVGVNQTTAMTAIGGIATAIHASGGTLAAAIKDANTILGDAIANQSIRSTKSFNDMATALIQQLGVILPALATKPASSAPDLATSSPQLATSSPQLATSSPGDPEMDALVMSLTEDFSGSPAGGPPPLPPLTPGPGNVDLGVETKVDVTTLTADIADVDLMLDNLLNSKAFTSAHGIPALLTALGVDPSRMPQARNEHGNFDKQKFLNHLKGGISSIKFELPARHAQAKAIEAAIVTVTTNVFDSKSNDPPKGSPKTNG